MTTSVSVRITPGQIAALNALVREEGGTIAGHIRTGLVYRLDLGEHRKAIHKILQEELKAALDAQRVEWDSVRAQMVETNLATLDSFRQLLASFMEKLTEGAPPAADHEPIAPPPTTAGGGVFMPPRSSR
jgi:uncharacterized coiled-coil protein SlyX